ncbi:hypothetical protein [Actinoplanes sp. CA-252034]|uniref:hypothetical protein n=1 Tax=Actinoplanes sp. CA-252034 TaxID=3239906 RepID=UPI003D987BDD
MTRSLVREDPFSGEARPRPSVIDRDLDALITDAQSRDWSADRPDRVIFARLGQARRRVRAAAGRHGRDHRPADLSAVLLGTATGLLTAATLSATGIPASLLPTGVVPADAAPAGTTPPNASPTSTAQTNVSATSAAQTNVSATSAAQTNVSATSAAQTNVSPTSAALTNAPLGGAVSVTDPLVLALTAVIALWTALLAVAVLKRLRRRWDRATVDGPAPIDDHYRYAAFRRRIEACATAARDHRSHRRRAAAIDLEYALDWLAAAQSELPRLHGRRTQ